MTASLGDGDDESHLLVLAGGVTGFVTGELVRTERLLVEATSARSALRERERLARTVHDGVLQLLALVQRQARDGTADWDVLASDAVLAVLLPQVADSAGQEGVRGRRPRCGWIRRDTALSVR
ncbi:MAG: hypothetical protein QOF87_4304 [Pseudonocardiales bacterium]|nr:hypothetical protein [Pseudonocardiales bacterium]